MNLILLSAAALYCLSSDATVTVTAFSTPQSNANARYMTTRTTSSATTATSTTSLDMGRLSMPQWQNKKQNRSSRRSGAMKTLSLFPSRKSVSAAYLKSLSAVF